MISKSSLSVALPVCLFPYAFSVRLSVSLQCLSLSLSLHVYLPANLSVYLFPWQSLLSPFSFSSPTTSFSLSHTHTAALYPCVWHVVKTEWKQVQYIRMQLCAAGIPNSSGWWTVAGGILTRNASHWSSEPAPGDAKLCSTDVQGRSANLPWGVVDLR